MQNATATKRSSQISFTDWVVVVQMELMLAESKVTTDTLYPDEWNAMVATYDRGDSGAVAAKKIIARRRRNAK